MVRVVGLSSRRDTSAVWATGLLMTNFRADRAREILSAICDPNPSQDMKVMGVPSCVPLSNPSCYPNAEQDAINIADRKKLRSVDSLPSPHEAVGIPLKMGSNMV